MIKKLNVYFVIQLVCYFTLLSAIDSNDAKKIGMLIWKNEALQNVKLLVHWNKHETFPSFGIGHTIWYPRGKTNVFTEQFPALCNYLKKNGVKLPAWLEKAKDVGAPWQTREEFLDDHILTNDLRNLLSSTIHLQSQYMIEQLDQEWPKILIAVSPMQKKQVKHRYDLMRSTALGTYALVDYLNFKGSGLNPLENKKGHRWGLLQVLLHMPNDVTAENVHKAFATSAALMLVKLIENSAPEYNSFKFLTGWMKRVNTYASPDILT